MKKIFMDLNLHPNHQYLQQEMEVQDAWFGETLSYHVTIVKWKSCFLMILIKMVEYEYLFGKYSLELQVGWYYKMKVTFHYLVVSFYTTYMISRLQMVFHFIWFIWWVMLWFFCSMHLHLAKLVSNQSKQL